MLCPINRLPYSGIIISMNDNSPVLTIKNASIAYHTGKNKRWHLVVQELNLELMKGDIACLLGASGCGKSTILRAICGFENLQAGEIYLQNQLASSSQVHVPPNQRKVGMVFQDFALFPHLNVLENVTFGLHQLPKEERTHIGLEWLSRVFLKEKAQSYPHELSGGQQQRVALARAMAPEPDLILLDEPFSSLDVDLRERLATEMREILQTNEVTALLVTHDQLEAFAIADFVGIMTEGKILQWDTPYDLYHRPINRYVADFIGRGVFVEGSISNNHQVEIELGKLPLESHHHEPLGTVVDVLLRADDIQHDDASLLQATIIRKVFRGADFLYTLQLPSGQEVFAYVPSHHDHAIGEKIGIQLLVDHVVVYSKDS